MTEPLQLVALLVIEELQRGDFLAWPFADPKLVAHGRTRAEAIEQQELFLREHLARLPGNELARFDPDAETTLELVEVPLQREDLPERVRLEQPLVFPCLIVPDRAGKGRDVWAVVLNLRHAIWIAEGAAEPELRTARIRGEIERIVAARELDGRAFLDLLRGADPFELERLTIEVDREERAGAEARAAARRRHARERSRAEARELLGRIGSSLVEELRRGRQPPVLHREREMASLDALLRGPERLALMLVGPELAGKTAVVHGLVQRWLRGSKSRGRWEGLPELVATSGAQLVAGQSGFGQLEQRVNDVMAAAEMLDAVLYFDNLSDLFARTSGELGDVAASMRPWLERGRVRLLGEISPEALEHHEKRHVGFFAYMNRIAVDALDGRRTHAILSARARHDRRYDADRPTLALPDPSTPAHARGRDAVTPLVDLAERYFSYQAFPGKALRFYASLRAIHEGELDDAGEVRPIGPDEVYRGFSIHSGIPMFLLREDRTLEYQRIVEFFHRRVIGQQQAIGRVAETLCTVKAGLQPAQKPLATFLFVGPTGVGKTEVAKTLARFLFGSPERMVRFDMSEYMDPLAAERLIRGSDRDDGVLTRRVRQQPFCVILLDEIEKAHPAVFDLLLQVCGEGRLSDARGHTTWFHNALIIMTSNLGAAHRRPSPGFGGAARAQDPAEAERYYLEQVDIHFRPEFVNRIDRVIPFHPLDRAQIQAVAEVSLARVRERDGIGERGITLEVASETLDRLAREGYSDTYGARALRRELEDRLVAPLARTLATLGDRSEAGTVRVRERDAAPSKPDAGARRRDRVLASEVQDELAIEVAVPTGRTARRTLDALSRVSSLRRSAAAAAELPPLRELRDRLRVLVAELGYGAHKRKGERSTWEHSAELGRLQAEHGRIVGTVERIDELRESIESAEELTIAALYEGEPAELFQDAAEDAYRELRIAIVDALLLGNERHAVTVHLQEQDPRGALLCFLLPLLDGLDDRGWRARFHLPGDKPGADNHPGDKSEPSWPADRPWGPPRTPAWLRKRLTAELEPGAGKAAKRRFRDVLMCLEGRHAGAVLTSLLGLFRYDHRWQHEQKRDKDQRPAHLLVRFISTRASVEPAEWAHDHLIVPKPLRRDELESTPRRAHFDGEGSLGGSLAPGRLALEPGQFWARIEEVMFTPLVERAFRGDDEEAA